MFDFLESDWFNISLQVIFLVLVIFDIKKYIETKKKEYIFNIVATVGFAIWTLQPYYKSYFEWSSQQKEEFVTQRCKESKDMKSCHCVSKDIYQEYGYDEYILLDKNSSEFNDFLKESREECLDDSWF